MQVCVRLACKNKEGLDQVQLLRSMGRTNEWFYRGG